MMFTRMIPSGNLSSYNPTIFNLIFYLPLTVWMGIFAQGALLLFLFFKTPKELSSKLANDLMFASVIAILIVFYALPYLTESNPRFVDSWVHGRTSKGISDTGCLNPSEFGYQAYPLSFIFLSAASTITGIELTLFLRILPLMTILLFFTLLTFFLNKLLKNLKLAIVSVFIFGLSTFYLSFHFSPEVFGWLFLFLLLSSFVDFFQKRAKTRSVSRERVLTLSLLIIGVAITHPVTQFSIVLILLLMLSMGQLFWKKQNIQFDIVTFSIVIFASWAISFGYSYFDIIIRSFGLAFGKISSDITSSIIVRPLQDVSPPEVVNLLLYRRAIYVVVILGAFFGGLLLRKRGKTPFNFLSSIAVAGALLLPLTVFGILPLERSIKLAFIPLSVFFAYLVCQKKKFGVIVLFSLLLTLPVNFASFYWNEATRMTHDWEVSSANFISSNFHGIAMGEFKETSIWKFFGNFSQLYNDYYLYGKRPDIFNMTFIDKYSVELVYITQLTLQKEALSGRLLDINNLRSSITFNCINSNGYSTILLRTKHIPTT